MAHTPRTRPLLYWGITTCSVVVVSMVCVMTTPRCSARISTYDARFAGPLCASSEGRDLGGPDDDAGSYLGRTPGGPV
jgi:hypothetical protein